MRRIKVILIALLCLPLIACFEDPVQEHLHVTIRADRTVVVTVVQEVASSNRGSDNPELADRLDEEGSAAGPVGGRAAADHEDAVVSGRPHSAPNLRRA